MSVSVEKTSNLGRRLTIQVPAANVQQEESQRLRDLAKNLRIEGFRKGKVPATYIQKKYGDQIHQEAVTNCVQQSLSAALKEQNLRPANRPSVEDLDAKQGADLKYTVVFEVYPEVVLEDFSKIELEKEVANITDEDVESGVQKLQDQFATWQDVDRIAQLGDKLMIDFVGLLDGEPFENGSANDQPLELGSNTFIPGFEEGLVGAQKDAETTIDVTFPEDYNAKHLAGKAAQFKVTVKSIQGKVPMAVDEEFAKRIGIADKDVNKVRAKVRENMEKYIEDLNKQRMREQVLDKLYAQYPLEIPQGLLDDETHNLIHEREGNSNQHDHGLHKHDDIPQEEMEKLRNDAKKRVTIGLILNEIIAKHNIQPEEGRVLAKMASMAMMYGANSELIQKMYHESKELRQSVQNMVLTEQAADTVVQGATIKEKQSTFYGIVDPKGDN